ncbi:argininosuccinate lyase [Ammoniphilus sp. YIM 78166]|uniref:argininosuccinate lyase n=1 Tax=Ammoniphilus sp. YIM 78166 TaxID=1644106 RepID=UPI00106F7B01|nr:argininosuccinate lyase [Ammoniphilus sp. YIM 78166]
MRERLKEAPAQEVISYLIKPWIQADLETSYDKLLEINKAHLVMLVEQGMVSPEDGREIIKVISELEEKGSSILPINYELEDLFFNIESYIIQQTGIEVGGRLHTGRSRNDFFATMNRMNCRDQLLGIGSLVNQLRFTLLEFAKKQTDVVMSGYTHMQPAEPITLGHYLSGILHSLERDYDRLYGAWKRVNECPMGSGALASTSFPIQRERTARFLGFEDITKNSFDGVASRDYLPEILSALSILSVGLSRLAHDLYIWTTSEFSYIEVGNSVAICSSIMPQKKNPLTLEHVKAKAAHVQGALISCLGSMKNTPFGHSCDTALESPRYFWEALREVEASVSILMATIKTLKVNRELMLERAQKNFCTVTELANVLVREGGISFTEAHQLVGSLVNDLLERKETPEHITQHKMLHFSKAVLGKEIHLTDDQLKLVLHPVSNVQLKSTVGGPAFNEVESQLESLWNQCKRDESERLERVRQMAAARARLQEKVNGLLSL